jgi:hypothetical protein
MLAPPEMVFFSKEWIEIGTRNDLSRLLSVATNIPSEYLQSNHQQLLSKSSVAQRMSWAATRSTTRIEDMAYCLLGIFDVNMPLLYGEGTKAFTRLQEEIIRRTNDQTIFTWGYTPFKNHDGAFNGLPGNSQNSTYYSACGYLARAPSEFSYCSNMVINNSWHREYARDFEITKRGLKVTLPLVWNSETQYHNSPLGCIYAVLNCCESGDEFNLIVLQLRLHKTGDGELTMSLAGPPWIRQKRLIKWPVIKTFYIVTEEVDKLSSATPLGVPGSIIIPRTPGFAIERLNSDEDITVEAPSGVGHYLLTGKVTCDGENTPGRAYFQFQRTTPSGRGSPANFLVLIVYNLMTPGFRLTARSYTPDILIPSAQYQPPDFSSVALSYSSKPRKLRRKRAQFEQHLEILYKKTHMQAQQLQKADKIRRYGAGWNPYFFIKRLYFRLRGISHTTVHCLIAKQSGLDGQNLKDPAFLEQLSWRLFIESNGVRISPMIISDRVGGKDRGCLVLNIGEPPGHLRYLMKMKDDIHSYRNLMGTLINVYSWTFAWKRVVPLTLLTFGCAIGAAVTITHQNIFAGGVWMALAMNFATICIAQPRPERELLPGFIYSFLVIGFFTALMTSYMGNTGISVIFISFMILLLIFWGLFHEFIFKVIPIVTKRDSSIIS